MWYKDSRTRQIIEEVAEEFNITPEDVLGVLTSFFDTTLKLMNGTKVKLFRVIGLGSLVAKGHVPKRANAKNAKQLKVDSIIKNPSPNSESLL